MEPSWTTRRDGPANPKATLPGGFIIFSSCEAIIAVICFRLPESQLEVWSHQGSIKQSAATYHTIKDALEAASAAYHGKNYQVFLQGSYGNDTNIYSESDVDVVI